MDLIKQELMQVKGRTLFQDQRKKASSMSDDSPTSSFTSQNIVVGFDDELIEIMDKLTGPPSTRQIIPIVGMGGIGKTTLAKKVYSHSLIQHRFDICAWITISQEYNVQEILKQVFGQVNKGGEADESELGVGLHKCLTGRRYLVVMDDMWSIEAWDRIKFFFPDNENGSRIIITTRQSDLASLMTDSYQLHKKLIDGDKSWNLFCKVVFGEEVGCPLEFKQIGKKIAQGCGGLPLSICVIGGVLAKSRLDRKYWEYIAEHLNSIVNLEDNERCLKVVCMSYNELPAYLKPCFLSLGVFPEDRRIRVSTLIELWVAEGFIKPSRGKSLEEVAKEYFKSLVDKNLIFVNEVGCTGNIKFCKIHDLLRDLCLRQALKERFYNIMKLHNPKIPQGTTYCLVISQASRWKYYQCDLPSIKFDCSSFYYSWRTPPLQDFQFLRRYKRFDSRLLFTFSNIPGNMSRFWNLHTIIVKHYGIMIAASEIWKMPQLRCVKFNEVELQDPPMDGNCIVLRNLHTLSTVRNFKCTEDIIKRIPNIKKLRTNLLFLDRNSRSVLSFLDRLYKLESFSGTFPSPSLGSCEDLNFPHSLKKLTIEYFDSKDGVLEMIGSLPFLEKLKLLKGRFHEHKWETVEGQFCSLKSLLIKEGYPEPQLRYWITESTHFPRLERLVLQSLHVLEEIPTGIGEIPTLQSIHLIWCCNSAVESAK